MLGPPFVDVAGERFGHTGTTVRYGSSNYPVAGAKAVAGAVSSGASGSRLPESGRS